MPPPSQPPALPDAANALPALHAAGVSVVICNHNYARYLPDAVASALAQTLACQVVVVDDGSTDGSRAWLQQHADPRVQVLLQPNGGQLAAYNAGFELCTGDVVIFLDADDALLPRAAEAAVARFGAGVAKVHFRLALMDEAGQPLAGTLPGSLAHGDVGAGLQRHGLLYPSPPGSGNAYRRSVLQRLFPLPVDPADKIAADFFVINGCVAWGRVAACDEVLGRYRLHRGQMNSRQRADTDSLVFGNAAQGNDEAAKMTARYARLRAWLAERSGGRVQIAPQFLDFSVQKTSYAQAVLGQPHSPWHSHVRALKRLLRALWLQRAYGIGKRLGLTAWAVGVLLAPRAAALCMARHVCNPASRV
jgi:hypothetical protein